MNALAIDESVDLESYALPEGVRVLDLNDEDDVIAWILDNAKVV
jgi:molybdopterin-guanine dinucleotide biosynthesis protein B